jgi:hypothetical protein
MIEEATVMRCCTAPLLAALAVACLPTPAPTSAKDDAPPAAATALDGQIEVTLVAEPTTIRPHEELRVHIRLTNRSKHPAVVLRPVDGAYCDMRFVAYTWTVTREGTPARKHRLLRCGNVNNFRSDNFITLAPGGSYTFTTMGDAPNEYYDCSEPGLYEVTLTYTFDLKRRDRSGPLERQPDYVVPLLRRAAPVTATSAPVRIEVVAPKK